MNVKGLCGIGTTYKGYAHNAITRNQQKKRDEPHTNEAMGR
jgi:hypothetical protein